MAASLQARFAAALLDPHLPVPKGVTTARGAPDARRFAVYSNTIHASLVAALEQAFPVTRALVGDAFFRAMAGAHVGAHKPRDPVLIHYGADFPAFIAAFAPAASLPYLADVARLERARGEAYHAADEPVLLDSGLAGIDPARLALARLRPHAAARLVESRFAIGAIWRAHQAAPPTAVAARQPEAVLVTRPAATVRTTILPGRDVAFTRQLLAGVSLQAAAGGSAADPAFDAGRALLGLVRLGAFAALHPPHEADDQ